MDRPPSTPGTRCPKIPVLIALLTVALLSPQYSLAAKRRHKSAPSPHLSGLSLSIDAGLFIPNAKQAVFYCGSDGVDDASRRQGLPKCPNTVNRVLRSEQFGRQMWNDLVTQGLISPSAIGSYSAFLISEYGRMSYKLTYQIGLGIRYDYPSGWGWLLRFDFSQIAATGQFLLSSNNGTGILGSNQYVPCDIYGLEKRIYIDLGLSKRIPLSETLELELNLGFDLNNTKISKHNISVAGRTYSILDQWGGRTPDATTGSYSYINQGGIGIGGFATVALSYCFKGGSIDLGYNAYYTQTKYLDFNESDCFALQHNIFLRFNLNGFSLFKGKS